MFELLRAKGVKVEDGEMEEIERLFCIDQKYPKVVLLNKVDRIILEDFDQIYINLLAQVKTPAYTPPTMNILLHNPTETFQSPTNNVPSDIEEDVDQEDIESLTDNTAAAVMRNKKKTTSSELHNSEEEEEVVETLVDEENNQIMSEDNIEDSYV